MRLLNKLKIFFRLKKEETIEFFKYNQTLHGLFGLILFTLMLIIGFGIISFIVGSIAHLFQSYEWWTKFFNASEPISNIMLLGAIILIVVFIYAVLIVLAILLFILLPFKFMKWIYSNWKLAEKELMKQEKKNGK